MSWPTEEVKTLITSGAFGSLVRIVLSPDKKWQRWIVQVFVGVSSAVFLGQVAGHIIVKTLGTDGMAAAYSAAGFLIGTAAEKCIEKLQNKFLDKE